MQNGKVKMADSLYNSTSAALVKDLSSQVSTYGDHGLTSVAVQGAYLYATYQAVNVTTGNVCNDTGIVGGRTPAQVFGCPSRSRLVRWPIAPTTGALGAEEWLLDTTNSSMCAQFATGSIDHVTAGADGMLYVSVGAGTNTNEQDNSFLDRGQYGGDPCSTGAANTIGGLSGHFRAQDGGSNNGKILKINPTTKAVTVYARGMLNPWRMTWKGSELWALDTGITDSEEINGPITQGSNLGFPCSTGNVSWTAFNDATQTDLCKAQLNGTAPWLKPHYLLVHPTSPAVISAIGWHVSAQRMYYGDYVNGKIVSISPQATAAGDWDLRTIMTGVVPVHLGWVPGPTGSANDGQLLYVDIYAGAVKSVPNPDPSPSGASAAALSGIVGTLLALAAAVTLAV